MGYRFPTEHERRIAFSAPESGVRDAVDAPPEPASTPSEPAPASSRKPKSRPSYAAIELVEANMAQDPRFDPDTKTRRER